MITLKDIKKGGRWKARSKMTPEEKELFNKQVKKNRDETIKLEQSLELKNKSCNEFKIVSPMYIPIRNKEVPDKKYALNMNNYRNRKSIVSNNLKIRYKELMKTHLK
jgi:hypothetical protein